MKKQKEQINTDLSLESIAEQWARIILSQIEAKKQNNQLFGNQKSNTK